MVTGSEASFVLWQGSDLLLIPTSTLFRQGEGWAVFIADAGRAHSRPIRIGQLNGLTAKLIDGLRQGDQVVAHPDDKTADGIKIKPRPICSGEQQARLFGTSHYRVRPIYGL